MRKSVLLLLCLGLFGFSATAQYNIIPGKGFDDVKIKMHIDDMVKVLGSPEEIVSFEDEKESWENGGYDIQKSLPFYIGFDEVYMFGDNKYAIWKVYVKKKKAVYVNLSSYLHDEDITDKISLNNDVHFYDNLNKVVSVLGGKYHYKVDEGENTLIFFLEQGIELIINEQELRNICFFKPMKAKKAVIQLGLMSPGNF